MREDIKDIIEEVVRERLSNANIVDVRVDEDTDCDGEDVYRVSVIYAGHKLDTEKTSSLIRYTRSRLRERNSYEFPIFRFISQSDMKRLRAAAA